MPSRKPGQNLLKQKPKQKRQLSPALKLFAQRALQLSVVIAIIIFIVMSGWQYIYKVISESYKPNAQLFGNCSSTFTQIKSKPSFGVVFKTENSEVKEILLTAPANVASLKSIELDKSDWVPVYFSNNFSSTQVGEFLRLSKLEEGKFDYCYVLEQLALTSGVPIEYVIVDDKEQGLSSSVSVAQTQEILRQTELNTPKKFNRELLLERVLEDGSKVSLITFDSFKEQFPSFFTIEEIAQEQAFVEVYNATDIDGYASIFSRKWSMLGIDISRVGNAVHEVIGDKLAVIYVKNDQQYPKTLSMIKSSFPEGLVEVRQGRPTNLVTTGDIVVFLLKR